MIKGFIKFYLWAEKIWFGMVPQKIRYLLVGGFNTVLSYSVLALLYWVFGIINSKQNWNYDKTVVANVALLVQYAICINVSFLTMRYYVFQSKGNWKKEFVKAWSVYVFLYLINAPIMTFLMVVLGLHPLLAQAMYLVFSTILTFILHKYYSFRKDKAKEEK